jgi:predicted nucleic acid-binding protein
VIVADCTLITQLFLKTDNVDSAEALSGLRWVVPPLWRSELRNVCRRYIFAGRTSLAEARHVMRLAEARLASSERHVSSDLVLAVVVEARCPAYDAEYVVLARTLGVPLVTSDSQLHRLFPTVAISPAVALGQEPIG